MLPDLTGDLERIAVHIPCLEQAAQDEMAPPHVRAAAAVELAAWRMARDLAGQHRTPSDETTDPRTETTPHD